MALLLGGVAIAAVVASPDDQTAGTVDVDQELELEESAPEETAEGLIPGMEGLIDNFVERLVDSGAMSPDEAEAFVENLVEGLADLREDLAERFDNFQFELPENFEFELPEEFGFEFEFPEDFRFEFPENGEFFRFRSPEDLEGLLERYPDLEGLRDLFRFFSAPNA